AAPGSWRAEGHFEEFAPTAWLPADSPLRRLRGEITAEFSGRGAGTRVEEGAASGRVDGLAWEDVLAPSSWTWTAEWADGGVRGTAREPRGLEARARWAPGQELVADLVLRDAPLEGWSADPRVPADLTGLATGDGQLRVAPDGSIAAEVALADLRLRVPPLTLANDGPVRLAYRGGAVRVERLQVVGEQLRVGASGELRPGESWDLKVEGFVDLDAVRRWVKAVRRSSGMARAELDIQGPWASPTINGPLTVEPGATLLLEAVDLPIQDLEASAHFDAGRGLTVEWIDAQVGQGRLHLEGLVGLEGLRPGKLRVQAEVRNIAYESPPQVTYLADADLLLTGTVERPEIRGDIRLKEFLYARRLNLKTLILEALKRRPREVQGVAEAGTVFVDVALRGSDNLRVSNNLADLSLSLDVRARGYLPRPVLWGRVEATGGTFRLRNQEYDVLRSSVEFLGETQPVPLLDIHVRTTQRQYTVNVDISGPLDRYQVTMASSPPLPQNDIVALLTLGTTAEEAAAAQGVTAAEAASFVTGGLQDEVEGGVGDLLGFDQFHIDPAYSPATQTTMPRVTVGKAITRALFARYSAAMGGETEQDLEVQYTLTPRIQLLGTWTDRGSQAQGSLGGEVRFRFGFR
ncbi:MAG: translocation/assembly module TamB, partial [Proteobacteria bacterium]|nr:translocation/assembly module TamB [Pseudomonadota bacterium]